jgi:two-component system sensor histidine kinase UhpB
MPTSIRLLILEDCPADANLIVEQVRHAGFDPTWRSVCTSQDYLPSLVPDLDVILADTSLREFDTFHALQILNERMLDIPFIVIFPSLDEDLALQFLEEGATDSVSKEHLALLGPCIVRALAGKRLRRERIRDQRLVQEGEQLLRLTTENTTELILIAKRSGRILYASPSHKRLLGYSSEQLLGRRFFKFFHPKDRSGYTKAQIGTPLEARVRRADGNWLWLRGSAFAAQWKGEQVYFLIARDISEYRRAQEEIRELFDEIRASRERLKVLSHRLLQTQERERRSIARELHDEIGQALTSVQLGLQAIEPSLPEPGTRGLLQQSMTTIEQTLQQVRDLSLKLRPSVLDDFGLVAALQWLVDRSPRAGLAIDFAADPFASRPPVEIETACFRVAQEALTNAIRHARARRVTIELRQADQELLLKVCDDGRGFDAEDSLARATGGASLGLLGMQERASLAGGKLEIASTPGQGTIICARFPLTSPKPFVERRKRRRNSP